VGGGGAVVGALLCGTLFLVGLAAKERDNRFCVSCHLHDEKFSRLIAATATDLAGFHHQRRAKVGCIACHGGAGAARHIQVWLLAGFDTLRFLSGVYAEPTHMRLPLPDAECRQCHTPILGAGKTASRPVEPMDEAAFAAEAETEGRGGTSYHAIREHGTVKIACVRCHPSHTTDSDAGNHFIAKMRVRPMCRDCHKDL
jgi:nitrate/TMAO reductase-like tetraheme cytochrome c subunit